MGKTSLNSRSITLSIIMILAVLLFINMRNTQMSKQRNLQSGVVWDGCRRNKPTQSSAAYPPPPNVQPSLPSAAPSMVQPLQPPPLPPCLAATAQLPLPVLLPPPPGQQYPSPHAAASVPLAQQMHYGQPHWPIPATPLPVATPIIQMQSLGAAASPRIGQTQSAATASQLPQPFVQPLPPSQPQQQHQPYDQQQLSLLYAAAAQPIPPTAGNPLSAATMMPVAGSPPNFAAADAAVPSPISQLLWQQQRIVQECTKLLPQGSERCRDLHKLKLLQTFEQQISEQLQLHQQTDQQWTILLERQRKLVSFFKEKFQAAQSGAAASSSPLPHEFNLTFSTNWVRKGEELSVNLLSFDINGELKRMLQHQEFKSITLADMQKRQSGGSIWRESRVMLQIEGRLYAILKELTKNAYKIQWTKGEPVAGIFTCSCTPRK